MRHGINQLQLLELRAEKSKAPMSMKDDVPPKGEMLSAVCRPSDWGSNPETAYAWGNVSSLTKVSMLWKATDALPFSPGWRSCPVVELRIGECIMSPINLVWWPSLKNSPIHYSHVFVCLMQSSEPTGWFKVGKEAAVFLCCGKSIHNVGGGGFLESGRNVAQIKTAEQGLYFNSKFPLSMLHVSWKPTPKQCWSVELP